MIRFRSFLAVALLSLTVAATASADENQAQAFVEKEHGNIKSLVEKGSPDADVKKAIDGMVDYDELTRRAFGAPCPTGVSTCTDHWKDLDGSKQAEVKGLLQQLVVKNYTKNINKTVKYKVTYKGSKAAGENLAKVRTEAKNDEKPRDPAVQVDYVIKNDNKVIDIVTEGSSMTKNYYDQFHKMLTTDGQGYDYLVKKLKSNIAKP